MSVLKEVFVTPALSLVGITPPDPTFGRYLAPTSAYEFVVIDTLPNVSVRRRRVFTSPGNGGFVKVGEGEDVNLTQAELDSARGKSWSYYQIWESSSEEAKVGKAKGCDLVLLHGELTNLSLLLKYPSYTK